MELLAASDYLPLGDEKHFCLDFPESNLRQMTGLQFVVLPIFIK